MGVNAESNTSMMKSYNYVEGVQGWIVKSNGDAEFQQLAANSVRAEAVRTGTVNADIIIGGSLNAVEQQKISITHKARSNNIATLTTVGGHGRKVDDIIYVRMDRSVSNDSTFDTPGNTPVLIVGVTENTISYENVGPNVGTTAHGGNSYLLATGRRIAITPNGIRMTQAGRDTVVLPTNTTEDAYFSGKIDATGLTVKNDLYISGTRNALGMGGVLSLSDSFSASAPPIIPAAPYYPTKMLDLQSYPSSGPRFVGMEWDSVTQTYLTCVNYLNHQSVFTIVRFNNDGVITDEIVNPINIPIGDGSTVLRPRRLGGVVRIGNRHYVLARLGFFTSQGSPVSGLSVKWYVVEFDATVGNGFSTILNYFEYAYESGVGGASLANWDTNNTAHPGLGKDGNTLLIGRGPLAATGTAYITKYTTAGARVSGHVWNGGWLNPESQIGSIAYGAFDYGSNRLLAQVNIVGSTQSTFNGSIQSFSNYGVSAPNSGEQFATNTASTPPDANVGFAWNGSRFVTITATGVMKFYSDYDKSGASLDSPNQFYRYSYAVWNGVNYTGVSWNNADAGTMTLTRVGHTLSVGQWVNVSIPTEGISDFYEVVSVGASQVTINFTGSTSVQTGTNAVLSTQYETSPSPFAEFLMDRRSYVRINAPIIPEQAQIDGVEKVNWWRGESNNGPWLKFVPTESRLYTLDTSVVAPTWVALGGDRGYLGFPSSGASKIVSSGGANKLSISGSGDAYFKTVSTDALPHGKVYRTTTHSIGSGGWNKITFNLTDTRVNIGWDGSNQTYVINRAGMYFISGQVRWTPNGTGVRGAAIYKNASAAGAVYGAYAAGNATHAISTNVATMMRLKVGDTIELRGYQGSGGNLGTMADASIATFLEVAYVGS